MISRKFDELAASLQQYQHDITNAEKLLVTDRASSRVRTANASLKHSARDTDNLDTLTFRKRDDPLRRSEVSLQTVIAD